MKKVFLEISQISQEKTCVRASFLIKLQASGRLWHRCFPMIFVKFLRGCSYRGELACLSGLARLGEMIFFSRSHGILYVSSIKKFIMSLEKDGLINYFLQ